jgi:TatD DNase family protein
MISLAGPVTYKNARALPEVARYVPEERLVVETDCPYLTPTPHRGKRNEPAYVVLTAAHVAALRGADTEAFGESVTRNAARLFKIALP